MASSPNETSQNDTELGFSRSHSVGETDTVWALWTTIVAAVSLLSVFANLTVIFVVSKIEYLLEYSKYFILSIALADFGNGLVCSLAIVPSITGEWPYGRVVCKLQTILSLTFTAVSVTGILEIHMERFVAIEKPLHYYSILSKRKCLGVIAATWVLYTAFATLTVVDGGKNTDLYDHMVYQCCPTIIFKKPSMFIYLIVLVMASPVPSSIGILVINYRITKLLKRLRTTVNPAVSSHFHASGVTTLAARALTTLPVPDESRGTYRTFIVVALAFHVSWVPLVVVDSYCFATDTELNPTLQFLLFWLAMSNSFWNFFIYSMRSQKFRNQMKRMVSSCVAHRVTHRVGPKPTETR
ncbi:beta-1 adrenergic receptor-like [Ptychodera flava]|uniref:beta-1 adrenergic receptor-like n=1 Tax=Ptychodera flava TaxID=63121 RepID=UPI003969DA81